MTISVPFFLSRLAPVLALVMTFGSVASAQARLVLDAGECAAEVVERVGPALDVELSNASVEARQALDAGLLRGELVCESGYVTARVVRGAEHVEQRIEMSGAGLARRVAIALAELVEASAGPSDVAPPPDAPPPDDLPPDERPPDDPPPDPPPAAETSPFRARLRVAGGPWLGGERLVALGTIELGVELAPTPNVAIVVGVAGTFGAVDVDFARLDVRMVSGAVSARFGAQVDAFWLGGGPALRGGAVAWSGTPSDPRGAVGQTTVGTWLGLGALAAAFVRVSELPLRFGLEVEGGGIAVYSGALVLGTVAEKIGGGWVEVRLAADFTFE